MKYLKIANNILEEINGNYENYRKQLLFFPEVLDFSKQTFTLNNMYIHRYMKLPCMQNETEKCDKFEIDLDLLKQKLRKFPEFELEDEYYVDDMIYYFIILRHEKVLLKQ